ncbi:hypothetical protein ACLBXM_08110 [Xanthobacteraceae bacterium A53D]
MITLGIRAAPKVVTFAVYDSDADAVRNVEEIRIPAAFAVPDRLKHVRSNVLDVLREYEVERAGIRICEPNAQKPVVARIEIEGVIQEAFASSGVSGYYIGQISSISARLGFPRTQFKPMVDGSNDLGIENWEALSEVEREAVLCAMGAARD